MIAFTHLKKLMIFSLSFSLSLSLSVSKILSDKFKANKQAPTLLKKYNIIHV